MKSPGLIVVVTLVLCCSGCDGLNGTSEDDRFSWGVYVVNEGAFNGGNAELSFIDPETGIVRGALFAQSNPGMTLGDVANHAVYSGGKLYICVNNSGYLQIVDASDARSSGRIPLSGLPRQAVVADAQTVFVTLMDSTVAVVDLTAMTEVARLVTGPFPEGIVVSNGRAFVMNSGFGSGRSVAVIDVGSRSVIGSIPTPDGPTHAVVGSTGTVYVVCTGIFDFTGSGGGTNGAIVSIDPLTLAVVDTLEVVGHPGKVDIDASGRLYVIGPGSFVASPVWVVETGGGLTVSDSSLVNGAFYGIGVDRTRQHLYLANAGDFVSPGSVLAVSFTGTTVRTYEGGIGVAPNGFVFIP